MPAHAYLWDVVVFLLATVLVVPLFERMRASPLVGYLLAGAVIGPAGFSVVDNVESMRAAAELGVVVLLFSIGLELTLERLKVMSPRMLGIGGLQLGVTSTVAFFIAKWAGMSDAGAIVAGAAVALSSTAVVIQLLVERHELATQVGRNAFALLLLQDLAVGPLLVLIPLLGQETDTIWNAMGLAAGKAAVALLAILVVGRLILRPLYRVVVQGRAAELFTGMNMLTIIGTGMATYAAGLSMALGALLAGILLAETEFRHRVEKDIRPFQGLLMGLFFMTVGMFIDVRLAMDKAELVALLVFGLLVGKALVIAVASRLFGLTWTSGIRLGMLLSQGGAFAFLFLGLAEKGGIVSTEHAKLLMLSVAVTMAVTPILAWAAGWVGHRFEPADAPGLKELEAHLKDTSDHIVIAGFDRIGRVVAERFSSQHAPYVIMEADRRKVIDGRARGLPVFHADALRPEALNAARIERASAAIVAMGHSPSSRELVSLLRYLCPEIRILAHARNEKEGRLLMRAGANEVAADAHEAGYRLAASVVVPVDD